MSPANFFHMHVHNLTSLEIFVEKGDHDILGLGHKWKELLLSNLGVSSVAEGLVDLILLVVLLHSGHSLFSKGPHHLLLILIDGEVII